MIRKALQFLGTAALVGTLACWSSAQQVQTAPPPARNVTPARMPAQRTPGAAPEPQGVLMGNVYWDSGAVKHSPSGSCSGLSLTVSKGTTVLGTFTNGFAYVGNVAGEEVCKYGVNGMPVEQDLEVQVNVTGAATFSPAVLPSVGSKSIKIMSGNALCNNLPHAVPTPADLSGNWWTCPNYAYNVNFILIAATRLSSTARAAGPVRVAPGTPNGTLLNSGAQPTLLGSGANSPSGDGSNSALLPAVQRPAITDGTAGVGEVKAGAAPEGSANPQGHAPQALVNRGVGTALTRKPALKFLGPPKRGSEVKNPKALQRDASLLTILQKQRSAADREAARTKLAIRSQGQAGTLAGPSKTMSAGGSTSNASVAQSPVPAAAENTTATGNKSSSTGADSQAAPALNGDGRVESTATAPAVESRSGGTLGASHTMDATGNQTSSIAHVEYWDVVEGAVLACTQDPAFRILTVSGSYTPATFTPTDQYNLYTIRGCSFGNQAPTTDPGPTDWVRVYGGTASFEGKFEIKFWSDNEIDVSLDPALSGFPDLDNLNLVVKRADGQQVQKGGFKFYAERVTVPLNVIPQQYVTPDSQQLYFSVNYTTPAADLGGYSAEFSRYVNFHKDRPSGTIYLGNQNLGKDTSGEYYIGAPFASATGSDYFDFSKLAPEFTTESFQMAYWQPDPGSMCGGNADTLNTNAVTDGHWDAEWDGNNIRVAWQVQDCEELELLQTTTVRESQYALQVSVNGPRCVDPWSGQPDQNCIAEVKKQFGE